MPRIFLQDDCQIWQFGCQVKDAASSAFKSMVDELGKGAVSLVKFLSTFWFKVPSPQVAMGDSESPVLSWFHGVLSPFVGFFAVSAFVIGIGRMAWTQWHHPNVREAIPLVRQVATVAAGSLIVSAATQLLIEAGDAFSPWIVSQASGNGDASEGLKTLLSVGLGSGAVSAGVPGAAGANAGLWLFLFVLIIFGSIAQCIFMVFRGPVLIVMLCLTPFFAATTASEEGWQRFKRLLMLILGFVLFKPVAACIYAAGIKLMTTTVHLGGGHGPDLTGAIYGLGVIVMAALALPAFIKFVVPAAAAGSSSAFSGAAVGAAVASGAAMVASFAGGGAGAGAGAGGAGAAKGAGPVPGGPGGFTGAPTGGPSGSPGETSSKSLEEPSGASTSSPGSSGPGGSDGSPGSSGGTGERGRNGGRSGGQQSPPGSTPGATATPPSGAGGQGSAAPAGSSGARAAGGAKGAESAARGVSGAAKAAGRPLDDMGDYDGPEGAKS